MTKIIFPTLVSGLMEPVELCLYICAAAEQHSSSGGEAIFTIFAISLKHKPDTSLKG